MENKIFWTGKFWAQSEIVKSDDKWYVAVCSKLNRHDQMKVAGSGMSNLDEEFWVM